MSNILKAVLRYPGGKSKAVSRILPLIPITTTEFREPFAGGASVFLAAKQTMKQITKFWINDLNYDLYCFWKEAQQNNDNLYREIELIKSKTENGKDLFYELRQNGKDINDLQRAIRFFILNRISFSGTTDCGGYSEKSFHTRFTPSSFDRLRQLKHILTNTTITHLDYEELPSAPSHFELRTSDLPSGVLIFLDPPYLTAQKSRLYGKNGDLHTDFDYERFAAAVAKCPHNWLITLDDHPVIRELFSFANIIPWELQYGMNNYKKNEAGKGKELFIINYDLDINKCYFDEQPILELIGI